MTSGIECRRCGGDCRFCGCGDEERAKREAETLALGKRLDALGLRDHNALIAGDPFWVRVGALDLIRWLEKRGLA